MKKLSRILVSALLLASTPALAAQAAKKDAAPAPGHADHADDHAGHDHAAALPPAVDPHAGHDHAGEAPPAADPHAGHKHAVKETEEDRARVAAANGLTAAKLKGLAVFEREQLRGTPFREALKKAKLKQAEIDSLNFLTNGYYRARFAARKAQKELDELRALIKATEAKKEQPTREQRSSEQLMARRLQEHENWRTRFLKKLAEQPRALLDQHEDEFLALIAEADEARARLEAESRQAAAKGFTEEKLSALLTMLQESARGAPHRVALEKSGLDRKDADGLSLLVAEYYNKKLIAEDHQKQLDETRTRLAAARAAKKEAAFDERLETFFADKLEGYAAFRAEFSGKYGKKLTDALEKRSAEFIDTYKKRHEALQSKE